MKMLHTGGVWAAILVVSVLALYVTGCGGEQGSPAPSASTPAAGTDSGGSTETAGERAAIASEIDMQARQELGGPKAEAKEWLKSDSHKLFVGDKAAVTKLVEDLSAKGATEIFMTSIEGTGEEQTASSLVVKLPKDKEGRKGCFEAEDAYYKSIEAKRDTTRDLGQKHMLVTFSG